MGIGVWGSKSGSGDDGLIGATGRDQVTSLIALYGPRTTVLVGLDDGVYEFSYGCTPEGCQLSDGTFAPWICSRSQITISEECKIFAPPRRWRATRSSSITTCRRSTRFATAEDWCRTCTSSSRSSRECSATPRQTARRRSFVLLSRRRRSDFSSRWLEERRRTASRVEACLTCRLTRWTSAPRCASAAARRLTASTR